MEAFGGELGVLDYPMHGKPSWITHQGKGVFEGLPERFQVGRYHSLFAQRETFPGCLEITAESEDGVIMGRAAQRAAGRSGAVPSGIDSDARGRLRASDDRKRSQAVRAAVNRRDRLDFPEAPIQTAVPRRRCGRACARRVLLLLRKWQQLFRVRQRCELLAHGSRVAGGRSRVGSSVRRASDASASAAAGDGQQRFHPAGDGGRRHHLVDGAVEQFARAEAREAPQLGFAEVRRPSRDATSASPSSVFVWMGSSSRLDAVRHISRSRLLLMRGGFLPPRGSRKAARRW